MIFFDEDSDARVFRTEAGTITARELDVPLNTIGGTRLGVLIVGVNAMKTNYPSKVMQSHLDGFDCSLGMGQPFMRGSHNPWLYRRSANFQVLFNQGIDSNAYLLDGARKRGVSPWIGVRMNDIHNGHDPQDPLHSDFWREHPELLCNDVSHPCENTFDYSHEIIRERFLALIEELSLRYNADGIFLDWMRWPSHVPYGKGPERAPLITDFMRKAKEIVRKAEARRGHGITLHARVPLTPENALRLGLDAVAWCREKIVDSLFIGEFGCGIESDAPVERWHEAIGNRFPVIVSLEHGYQTDPSGKKSRTTTMEEARGVAAAAYHRGAEGVHLFNWMGSLRDMADGTAGVILNDLDSIELLRGKNHTFRLSWDDSDIRLSELDRIFRIPGFYENWCKERDQSHIPYPSPLPKEVSPGEMAAFRLYTAWKPEEGAGVKLRISVETACDSFGVRINGNPFRAIRKTDMEFESEIPPETLADGFTRIEASDFSDSMNFREISLDVVFRKS